MMPRMKTPKKKVGKVQSRDAVLVIHNVRSAHNVGAMFRTADGAGISKVFCAGYTPTPIDRFGRPQGEIAKTALGAEQTLPWESRKSTATLLRTLKRAGYQIIAVEQDPHAISYTKVRPQAKVAFVAGNEVGGISKSILRLADVVAEIPMKGNKESLNVSVAAGVALFRMLEG